MIIRLAPIAVAALLLAGCAPQRSAVSALGAQPVQPVELHVYVHNPDGTTTAQPAVQVQPVAGAQQYQATIEHPVATTSPAPVGHAYRPQSFDAAPYASALVVDAEGTTRPTIGSFKGSEPGEPVSFTAEESAHIKIVWIAPRTGEMLIVPLTSLQNEFYYPLASAGGVISPYGWRNNAMHTGTDLKALPGDTVYASLDGVVRMSQAYGGYGNLVVIRHPNGLETLYGHNLRNLVQVNQPVHAGQPIALAGRSGRASTEHVHYEVRSAGRALDPALMVDFATRSLRYDTLYIYNQGELVMALKGATAPDYFNAIKSGLPPAVAAAGRAFVAMGKGHVYADPPRSNYPTTSSPYPAQTQSYYESATTPATGYYPSNESLESARSYESFPSPPPASRLDYMPGDAYEYHVMRPKETLFALTRLYGISIHELLALNPQITDPNHVLIGERVRIRRK